MCGGLTRLLAYIVYYLCLGGLDVCLLDSFAIMLFFVLSIFSAYISPIAQYCITLSFDQLSA